MVAPRNCANIRRIMNCTQVMKSPPSRIAWTVVFLRCDGGTRPALDNRAATYLYYTPYGIARDAKEMGHTIKDKTRLLNRVRRVRGQIEAVERALEAEKGCTEVLHLVVAVRGAMNSLMAELIEGHIRE